MKLRSVMFGCCLLTALSVFSQRLQIENGDTLAVLPIESIRTANVLFVQGDSMKAEIAFAKHEIEVLTGIIQLSDSIIQIQQQQSQIKDQRIALFSTDLRQEQSLGKRRKIEAFLAGTLVGSIVTTIITALIKK